MIAMKLKHPFFFVLGLYCILALQACGFHLRGSVALPPVMAQTQIQGTAQYSELGLLLQSHLRSGGVEVVQSSAVATAILAILEDTTSRRTLTVNSAGQVTEYELTKVLRFQVSSSDGEILVPAQKISLVRDYRFDPDNVLSKGDEEAQLQKTMTEFAVQQIMRRILIVLRKADKKTQDILKDKGKDKGEENQGAHENSP